MNYTPEQSLPTLFLELVRQGMNKTVRISPVLIVIILWEGIVRANLVSQRIVPSFTDVASAWIDLIDSSQILTHLLVSLYRACTGLVIGTLIGVTLGILMAQSATVQELVEPFITLTFPLPKTAFVPIVLLWLGVGSASSILIVVLATIMPMTISAYHGGKAIHKEFIWSAKMMGASRWRVLTSIVIPGSLPYIINGLRIALAFSIVVVISTEMIAARIGIGQFIYTFGESGNYDYMFATVLTVVAATFGIDRGFLLLSRHFLRWANTSELEWIRV